METRNKKTIIFEDCFENLKKLVVQKINLEQKDKKNSPDYSAVTKNIQKLMTPLSIEDLNVVKIYCKQEYQNLINVLRSDIDKGVARSVENKMNINYGCSDIIDKFVNLKKDKEYAL